MFFFRPGITISCSPLTSLFPLNFAATKPGFSVITTGDGLLNQDLLPTGRQIRSIFLFAKNKVKLKGYSFSFFEKRNLF